MSLQGRYIRHLVEERKGSRRYFGNRFTCLLQDMLSRVETGLDVNQPEEQRIALEG